MKIMNKPEIVVVTGASAGLGRAIVRAFAHDGAHVGLIARGRDGLEGAHREVEELGGKAVVYPADVADAAASRGCGGCGRGATRPYRHLGEQCYGICVFSHQRNDGGRI